MKCEEMTERLTDRLKGLLDAEAGRELGCAEGTVSWRVHEAKKHLRKALPHEL